MSPGTSSWTQVTSPAGRAPVAPRRLSARLFLWMSVGVVLLAGLVATRQAWLPLPAHWLVVNEPLERADVIVVLSAGSPWRNQKAAELYRRGLAPKIITLGDSYYDHLLPALGQRLTDAELNALLVARYGVPAADIVPVRGRANGTYDEARLVRHYLQQENSIRSLIVVTSGFHSRRARWVFRQVLHEEPVRVAVVEAESPDFTAANWWQSENGWVALFNEYVKFAYYWFHYGP